MKQTIFRVPTLILGIILGVSLATVSGVFADKKPVKNTLPLKELRTFTDVLTRIKSEYVVEVTDQKLLEDAIQGMLAGLDPHSAYLNKKSFEDLKIGTTGQFGGLGIEVTMEDGFVKVITPIDDTPAQRAGVQAGDLIIRLDDQSVKGMTLSDAVDIMRGKPGTPIKLTILREGEQKPLIIELLRAIITVTSVKSRLLEDGFGYVRISRFQTTTGKNLLAAINKLEKENNGALKGMVLDLRNNPGGVLQAAVTVSDIFLEKGLIVYTEGRNKRSKVQYKAKPNDALNGAPLIVLINGGSASAAEIVAGALQDHSRAIIMGNKSFGKASVQTILPLSNGSALKLTTARYYTPLGHSIQAKGITPDIVLERGLRFAEKQDDVFKPLKEADLNGHLSNRKKDDMKKMQKGSAKDGMMKDEMKDKDDKKPEAVSASKDYQLHEALNLLKGLAILQKK